MRALALVESPAQLLNVIEWGHANRVRPWIVELAPTGASTRAQLAATARLAAQAGLRVDHAEVRMGGVRRIGELAGVARLVRQAEVIVLGDPFSGLSQVLLNVAGNPRLVVVDDGTSTLRYAKQWSSGVPLVRWDQRNVSKASLLVGRTAFHRLGNRSPRVELFTAMPVRTPGLPLQQNHYDWVRTTFGPPTLLDGTDMMGTSLVESGIVAEGPYLGGIRRLIEARTVRRYLPHRKESADKLRIIESMGVELVRPDLPMEVYARIGPIGRRILSFPSTVVHTLPLVLAGCRVEVEPIGVDDDWFSAESWDAARDFVQEINRGS